MVGRKAMADGHSHENWRQNERRQDQSRDGAKRGHHAGFNELKNSGLDKPMEGAVFGATGYEHDASLDRTWGIGGQVL